MIGLWTHGSRLFKNYSPSIIALNLSTFMQFMFALTFAFDFSLTLFYKLLSGSYCSNYFDYTMHWSVTKVLRMCQPS